MSARWIIRVGEFSIAQANALADGVFLSAVPPLTAWVGLGTALGLRLGKETIVHGIIPVIGEVTLHRGHAKYVRYRTDELTNLKNKAEDKDKNKDKDKKNKFLHPTIDDRRTSLNAYLLLDITLDTETDKEEIEKEIEQALIGLRLAGGVIHPIAESDTISVKLFPINNGQKEALKETFLPMPSYFYLLEDASNLVSRAREENRLKGFEILTAPMQRWAGEETEEESKKLLKLPPRPAWLPKKDEGYYRPMAIGYQLLEKLQLRQGSRNHLPHAFAEPVFTLIRFRTLASIRKNDCLGNGSYIWLQGQRAENVFGACPVSFEREEY